MPGVNNGPSVTSTPNQTAVIADPSTTAIPVGGAAAGLSAAQISAGVTGPNGSDAYGTIISPNGSPAALLRNISGATVKLGYSRALPREVAPTISVNVAAMASSQEIDGVVAGQSAPNFEYFAYYGAAKSNFAPRSSAVTQNKVCQAARASADTLGATVFTTSFFLQSMGNSFDILYYKDGVSDVSIFVDGLFCGRIVPSIRRATAQAGSTATTMVLDAGASATNGFYNQCYVRITGGTGTLGEVRQITGYVGASKTATVNAAWTVTPDGTTTFAVDHSPVGSIDPGGGTVQYINVTFSGAQTPPQPTSRLIQIQSAQFMGINIGQNDGVTPGPPLFVGPPMLFVGDSYMDGTRSPDSGIHPVSEMGIQLGVQPIGLSSGSTGWWTRGINNRLSFLNRVAPPTEAWEVQTPTQLGYTGGTFSASVTYNGVTKTVTAIPYNVTDSVLENGLNALTFNGFNASSGVAWVGPSGQGCFCVARGDLNAPWILIANGMVGATITVDFSGCTGGSGQPTVIQYVGDVAKNAPKDANGNYLPFLMYIQGSGNDTSASGYSDIKLQTNAVSIAQYIRTNFPQCVCFFGGIVTNSDGTGGNGIITAADYAHNQAIKAGAAQLNPIHGQIPFVDTYSAGVGGNAYYTGGGSVGNPTNAKRDIMKSLIASGHPTGIGKSYWTARDSREMLRIYAGMVA